MPRRFIAFVLLYSCAGTLLAQSASLELLYNWRNPNFAPSTVFANTYNECWGFVQDDREYGVIGSSWGTHIFDLDDPEQIVPLDSVQGAYSGPGVIHRDFENYRGYLYAVCDEGSGTSTLQIMDLRTLPDSVTLVYDSRDLFSTVHNIEIDTATGRLYCFLVGFAPGFSSVAVYSLENPLEPVLLKIYNDGSQVHDGYVRNNLAYLNDGYNGRILIVNWEDAENPVILGSLDSYPDRGYNHSGWLHPDGDVYVFADENHGAAMKVCDVSDPTDIQVLSTISSEVDAMSIPHNQIIRENYLFTAYYHDGLYIHDISDPENPVYVAHYKTYEPADHVSYRGAWGVFPLLPSGLILVSDMQYGLFVFRANGLGLGTSSPPAVLSDVTVYPNPFASHLRIELSVKESATGRIVLCDLSGREQAVYEASWPAGSQTLNWSLPAGLTDGLYILRLEAGQQVMTESLVRLTATH